jgi:hypothetical protein
MDKECRGSDDEAVVGIPSFASATSNLVPYAPDRHCFSRVMLGVLCTCHLRATFKGPAYVHRAFYL